MLVGHLAVGFAAKGVEPRVHTKSQAEDGAAVLLDEQSKGVAVTRLRPRNRAAGLHFHPSFRLRPFIYG